MRILLIFGTRPEAIKMCPLILALKKRPAFETRVIVTGQHEELVSSVLSEFGIVPDHFLHLMHPDQTPEQIGARMLLHLPALIAEEAPDLVLVHGDTASAFAASLSCFYQNIPVAHVEAGLRTGDLRQPFPEEMHRRVIDLSSAVCFAPTESARQALLHEGKPASSVFVTGNTGIDALRYTLKQDYQSPLLPPSPYLFLTAHRRENRGDGLRCIFSAARRILDLHPNHRLLCPLHPSPAVQSVGREILGSHPRAILTDSLSLTDCHNLLARADLVLTDSGGIQEECAALGRKALVLRNVTERPEGVASGALIPVGAKEETIVSEASRLLSLPPSAPSLCIQSTLYGKGNACEQIADLLEKISL